MREPDLTMLRLVRYIHEFIGNENESAKFEARAQILCDLFDEPIGDDPDRTYRCIELRREFVEDFKIHVKDTRHTLTEQTREVPEIAMSRLSWIDETLLKERTALAADRTRVKHKIFSYPSYVKFDSVYMIAINDNLPESPSEARDARSQSDRTLFRRRLIKAYDIPLDPHTPRSDTLGPDTPRSDTFCALTWCPVFRDVFPPFDMTAAHIVPCDIGEDNAAYLFGTPLREGHELIWSERNGLMMCRDVEKIFTKGEMVILPDPSDPNEFISVILSEYLLEDTGSPRNKPPMSTIHNARLQFQTSARPEKRYIYMRAMLSLFKRRRSEMAGWEKDHEKVFGSGIWALPPDRWARRSMVEALASEVGGSWPMTEASRKGLGEFPGEKSPEEETSVAKRVRWALSGYRKPKKRRRYSHSSEDE